MVEVEIHIQQSKDQNEKTVTEEDPVGKISILILLDTYYHVDF